MLVGIFGKVGELQTILCVSYGPNGVLYSGTLSGDIYKWQENNLVATIPNAHSVRELMVLKTGITYKDIITKKTCSVQDRHPFIMKNV